MIGPRRLVAALLLGACLPLARGAEEDPGYINWHEQERLFAERLGKANRSDYPPPGELVRQLREQKRFEVRLPAPAAKPGPLEPAELFRRCRAGVVAVGHAYKCNKCPHWHASCASGFVLTPDGVVATNYHVVDQEDESRVLGVRMADGSIHPVREVLASSKDHDVALVRIQAEGLPTLPLGGEAAVGESVFVLSHPVGALYTFTEGMVSNKFLRRRRGVEHREFSITADFAKGSSGGPILNRRGEVVGIVRATDSTYYEPDHQNLQMVWKYCVPADYIRELTRAGDAKP